MSALAVVSSERSRAATLSARKPWHALVAQPGSTVAEDAAAAAGEQALKLARQLYGGWLQRSLRQSAFRKHAGVVSALPVEAVGRQIRAACETADLDAVLQPGANILLKRLERLEGLAVDVGRVRRNGVQALAAWDRLIEAALEILQGFTDLEIALAAHRAANDSLTGLPGRAALQQRLCAEHALQARTARPCAVAILDIDHFKHINDQHGHLVGDRVLATFARLLRGSLRPYDGVYRYGGEEFVLCLPGVDAAQAAQIIDRIRDALSGQPVDVSGQDLQLPIQFSAGVAGLQTGHPVVHALRCADGALYQAKRDGRNRVRPQPAGGAH